MWQRLKTIWKTSRTIDTLLSLAGFRPGPKQMARERREIIEDIKRKSDELKNMQVAQIRDTSTLYAVDNHRSHLSKTR